MRRRSSNHLQASKHTTSKVAVNKVATPMIGFAAAVGTTTLPEGRNAISANNLVTRIQSWLNHLHSKVVMVNSKAVTVNSKAVMVNSKAVTVNSKAVTVINQHTTNSQHTTDHQLATAERMIGFALNAGTIILLSA